MFAREVDAYIDALVAERGVAHTLSARILPPYPRKQAVALSI